MGGNLFISAPFSGWNHFLSISCSRPGYRSLYAVRIVPSLTPHTFEISFAVLPVPMR